MEPCCQNPDNRTLAEKRGDLTIEHCQECGRRHIELTVDPAKLGIKVT